MVVQFDPVTGTFMTVRGPGEAIRQPTFQSRERRPRFVDLGAQTTMTQRTPSASEFSGTSQQRQRQLAAFQTGGRASFEQEIQRTRRQEQQSRTIAGQVREGVRPSQVQPFTPGSAPLPSRRELDAQRGFATSLASSAGRGLRRITGERRREDIGATGTMIPGTGLSGVFVPSIPTGTVIDPRVRQTQQTIKQKAEEEFLTGGLGTPQEFDIQNIQRTIVQKQQRELTTEQLKIQRQINTGEITFQQGQQRLDKTELELEKELTQDFSKQVRQRVKERGRAEGILKEFRRSERGLEAEGLVRAGVIGAGLAIAPVGTQAALLGVGGAEVFSSVQEPTKGRKAARIAGGLFEAGLGAPVLNIGTGTVARQVTRAELTAITEAGTRSPFKLGELGQIIVKRQTGADITILGARKIRESGAFTQELRGVGLATGKGAPITKVGGVGVLQRETTVTLGRTTPIGFPVPKPVTTKETFGFATVGISVPTGPRTSAVFGKGVLLPTGRRPQFIFTPPVAGGVARVSPELSISQIGKLRTIGRVKEVEIARGRGLIVTQQTPRSPLFVEIERPDIAVTRTIRPRDSGRVFSIRPKTGGQVLASRLPSPTTDVLKQQVVLKALPQARVPLPRTRPTRIAPTGARALGIRTETFQQRQIALPQSQVFISQGLSRPGGVIGTQVSRRQLGGTTIITPQAPRQRLFRDTGVRAIPITGQGQTLRTIQPTRTISRQIQGQKLRPRLLQEPGIGITSRGDLLPPTARPPRGRFQFGRTGGGIPVGLPIGQLRFGQRPGKAPRVSRQRTFFQPSLTAGVFSIKGKRRKLPLGFGESPFKVRAIQI